MILSYEWCFHDTASLQTTLTLNIFIHSGWRYGPKVGAEAVRAEVVGAEMVGDEVVGADLLKTTPGDAG